MRPASLRHDASGLRRWALPAVLACAFAALVLGFVEHAQGRRAARLAVGREAMDGIAHLGESEERLVINGAQVRMRYLALAEPPASALDGLERECGGSAERYQDEGQGYVLCAPRDPGERRRFAYVRGRSTGSLLVSLETATGEELEGMFPSGGDAPGDDLRCVPRPRDARRTMSVDAPGAGQRMVGYVLERGRDAVARETRTTLRREGWTIIETTTASGVRVMRARRPGRTVDLAFAAEPPGTTMTATETMELRGAR